LPLAVVEHPVGGITRDQAAGRITDEVIDTVVTGLSKDDPGKNGASKAGDA